MTAPTREYVVHFKIVRGTETKQLRVVLYADRLPTAADYERCLRENGYEVQLIDEAKCLFQAEENGQTVMIDVMEERNRAEENERDPVVEKLARSFMKKEPRL